jgi:orotidine-5'-phosphate decarboxylase
MSPIFVALDTQDVHRAAALARDVGGVAAGVKIGLEFFCANGDEGVVRIAEHGTQVFLDLKLHDIPNTVEKAVHALAHLQPAFLTVHAAGGKAMMAAAKAAAPPQTKVVGVTVLTSLDEADLASVGIEGSPANQVERLARLSREAGLDGIVCSGAEVAAARAAWPDGFLVVPGVRPASFDAGDQKRTVTPAQALSDGASVLVVGRPITQSVNPRRAIMDIAASLEQTPP